MSTASDSAESEEYPSLAQSARTGRCPKGRSRYRLGHVRSLIQVAFRITGITVAPCGVARPRPPVRRLNGTSKLEPFDHDGIERLAFTRPTEFKYFQVLVASKR
jgi:hypothetical protein